MKPLGSFSFFQTNQYSIHGCFTPSFIKINLLVSEKKIFEGFLTYIGYGGHLGHVT